MKFQHPVIEQQNRSHADIVRKFLVIESDTLLVARPIQ
jgi:hypothetical protein